MPRVGREGRWRVWGRFSPLGAGSAQVFGHWLLKRLVHMGAAFLFSSLALGWRVAPGGELCEGVGGC